MPMRRVCLRRGLPFTTSFHTRFPDYIAERVPLAMPLVVRSDLGWLRRFHAPARAVMAATPTLSANCASAASATSCCGRAASTPSCSARAPSATLDLPRPIFLYVGRVAVEKNIEAFLALDLPGTKVVVGDGPARAALARQFPDAVFLGAQAWRGAWREVYAAADVFVFPSLTDTFGLVLLEALASGVPVAAFPAAAPRDVIGDAPVGVLDEDLQLRLPRARSTARARRAAPLR